MYFFIVKCIYGDDFDDFGNNVGPETSDEYTDTAENEEETKAKKQTATKAKCEHEFEHMTAFGPSRTVQLPPS